MAIQATLDRLLGRRRLTPTEVSERIGITLANRLILKTNKARAIRVSTLEALCRALECQPGDLLVYGGGDAEGVAGSRPVHPP